ncbi:tetratricopeptide repeat protein [Comamonas aquatilis]|uniref:tetratricopeptide repeat protein n=1 Tax=Comamonas aquatilis TaxID=1778406 RepID=UPI0039EEC262
MRIARSMSRPGLVQSLAVLALLAGSMASPPLLAQTAQWQSLYDKAMRQQADKAYGPAEQSAHQALELAQQQRQGQQPYMASSLNLLGLIQQAQGRNAEAVRSLTKALELSQASLGTHANTASVAWNLGNVQQNMQQPREALQSYQRSLDVAQALPLDATSLALREKTLQALSSLYASLSEHDKAQAYLRQLSTLLADGAAQTDVATRVQGLLTLAQSLEQQGRLQEGQQALSQALALQEKAGASSTNLVPILLAQAGLHSRQDKDAQAAAEYERARVILTEQAPQALVLAQVLNELGLWQAQSKDYVQAYALFEQAQAIASQHAPDVLWQAHLLSSRARMAEAMRQEDTAQTLYAESLVLYRSQDRSEALLGQAGALNGLAGLAYRKRRFKEAQPMFTEALGLMEQAVGRSDARLLPLLDNLAALHRSLGRPGESEHARRATALRKQQGRPGE